MKKIILSLLIFATVIAIDAKQTRQAVAAPTKTELKNMVDNSKDLLNPAVSPTEKKAIADRLMDNLKATGLEEYAQLLVEREKIANSLKAAKAERTTYKQGWLFSSAEWHAANKEVNDLNAQLRDKNKQIRSMEMAQSKEESNTTKLVVASVVATIGVLAAMEYYFYPEGYMRTMVGRTRTIPTIEVPQEITPATISTPIKTKPRTPYSQRYMNRLQSRNQ